MREVSQLRGWQLRSAGRQDRESRLRAFRAYLAQVHRKLEREVNGDKNADNYMEILPNLSRDAAFVETDIPSKNRQEFTDLVTKVGGYAPSKISRQTKLVQAKDGKLNVLSDLDKLVALTSGS